MVSLPPPPTPPTPSPPPEVGVGPRASPSSFRARLGVNSRSVEANLPAMMFPILGIHFFLTHPFLFPLLQSRFFPCLLLATAVLVLLFVFTYLPQVAFLALFHRGQASAWINGTFLVLSEASVIVSVLFEAFLADGTLIDVFDAVLVYRGCAGLVATSRPVRGVPSADDNDNDDGNGDSEQSQLLTDQPEPVPASSPVDRLGKLYKSSVYSPFSCRQITEFVILIPLNLIPYIGVPLFLYLTGYRAGPLQHWRYFHLHSFRRRDRRAWIRQHRQEYTAFGVVFLILQLVPVFSMFFLLTSAVGSALWAAALERRTRGLAHGSDLEASEGGQRPDGVADGTRSASVHSHPSEPGEAL